MRLPRFVANDASNLCFAAAKLRRQGSLRATGGIEAPDLSDLIVSQPNISGVLADHVRFHALPGAKLVSALVAGPTLNESVPASQAKLFLQTPSSPSGVICSSGVHPGMIRSISDLQIVWRVILFAVIDVMNNFIRGKWTVELLGHHETMFKDVSRGSCVRVSRSLDQGVSAAGRCLSSFPSWIAERLKTVAFQPSGIVATANSICRCSADIPKWLAASATAHQV